MMPLEYAQNHKDLEALIPVLEEQAVWFYDFIEHLFYPESKDISTIVKKPKALMDWMVYANRSESIQPEIIEKISVLYSDISRTADILIDLSEDGAKKPPAKEFKDFITLHDEFSRYIRRLTRDFMIDGSGFDAYSGLRSKAMLYDDVSREMERLARQGKNFCLSILRIDHFSTIREMSVAAEADAYIKLVAGLIKISIRSFDDAYYLGEGEFVLCLKQTEISGGISALERLRKELLSKGVLVPQEGGGRKQLSMSCCIAEPLEGDKINDLIFNLKEDLASSKLENADTVLKYRELSPLQRFVQEEM